VRQFLQLHLADLGTSLSKDAVDTESLHGSKCGWDKNFKEDY